MFVPSTDLDNTRTWLEHPWSLVTIDNPSRPPYLKVRQALGTHHLRALTSPVIPVTCETP